MNCKVCGNTSVKNTSLSFFRFPKENAKCRDWAERCDMLNLYEKHGTLRFYKSFRICSDHFDPKDIVFDGRKKRLLQSAMPRILIMTQKSKRTKLEAINDFKHGEIFQLNLVENLCRLCAEENKNLTDIYGWKGRILNLEAKLKYFPLVINKYDDLPLKVCSQCISKVNQIHDFILNCIKAETKLRIMLDLKDCEAPYKRLKPNAECLEKVDWTSGIKKSLKEIPNFDSLTKVHNSFNPLACLSANVEDNYYKQVLQDNFINENDASCFFKQPELDYAKKIQLSDHTNFIRGVDFSGNISFEHDYSNMVLREQFQSELKNNSEVDQNFANETKHPCDIYLESFHNTKTPNAHSITHSVESELFTELFCEACNKFFFSRFELDEHTSQHLEGSFVCKICDKKFHKVAFLEKHLFDHKVNNSYDCITNLRCSQICLKSDEKTRLKCFLQYDRNKPSLFCNPKEKNSKLGKINFKSQKRKCQFCGRLFKNRQVCVTHEKSHVGEIPYKCKQCRKTFRSKQSLRQHRSVHSDKRRYNCEECGMSFKRKDTLNNHLRIHTGERPFVCKVCGFAFKQRGDCIKHEKNHQKTCKAEVKGNDLQIQNQAFDGLATGSSTKGFIYNAPQTNDGVLWNEENITLPSYVILEEITPVDILENIASDRIVPFNFLM